MLGGPTITLFVSYSPYILDPTTCNIKQKTPHSKQIVQDSNYIVGMASITMTASFVGGATLANRSPVATQRRLVVASAARAVEGEKVKVSNETDKESPNGRRNLMFAAAAAAVCSVAGMAVAEELKRGTPAARKAYAPICVTMPTARICHK